MTHACPHCGSAPGVHAWATGPTGDTKAIASLEKQAKAAEGRGNANLAALLRTVANKIRIQRDWLAGLDGDINAAVKAVVRAVAEDIRAAGAGSVPDRVEAMGITTGDIERAIASQMVERRQSLDDTMAAIVTQAIEQIGVGAAGPPRPIPGPAVRRAAERIEQRLWQDAIIKPAAQGIQDGLQTGAPTDDLDTLADRIEKSAGVSRGRAVTEARTQLAEFDRAVTASGAGEEDVYAYLGPDDAITRPFCAELVGHVFTVAQVAKMNNAQTVAPPIISGGGYNCRHSLSPLSPIAADAMGLPRGTMAQVKTANRRARARR